MNNMFPVWTLSSLILSYTLALPVFNNSRVSMETFTNVTEIMEYNETRLMDNMETFPNVTETNQTSVNYQMPCRFASWALQKLGNDMQNGDEKAGNTAQDPFGPGKK